jgi:hypothetical protein
MSLNEELLINIPLDAETPTFYTGSSESTFSDTLITAIHEESPVFHLKFVNTKLPDYDLSFFFLLRGDIFGFTRTHDFYYIYMKYTIYFREWELYSNITSNVNTSIFAAYDPYCNVCRMFPDLINDTRLPGFYDSTELIPTTEPKASHVRIWYDLGDKIHDMSRFFRLYQQNVNAGPTLFDHNLRNDLMISLRRPFLLTRKDLSL